jgi:hypothetical protein
MLTPEFFALRDATVDARRRMDDPTLTVAVCNGQYVVQSAVPQPDGTYTITDLSDRGSALEAIAFLNNL